MQFAPPVHEHVPAPLQVTVQSPPVQFVTVQLCAPWQVSVQSPPAQSTLQVPPVQSSMQLPPAHVIAHDAELVQVWWQSPPGHAVVQVAPDGQA